MRKDEFDMRVIDLMMSVDRQAPSERKNAVMRALAESLTQKPKVPWYRRIFGRS